MGKFPFKRPRIISKKFPELDSSIDGVTKSLNDLVFTYQEHVSHVLSKKHWMMAFSSLTLLLVLGSFISPKGKAQSSVFYPETCLGGWVNPHNAEGELDTTSNGDESQFTIKNSSILPKNTNAEMYCGSFRGKFDTATKPTKIIVSLALTKGADLHLEDMLEGRYVASSSPHTEDIASSTKILLQSSSTSQETVGSSSVVNASSSTSSTTSTSQDAVIATPGSVKNTGSSIVDGIIKSMQDVVNDIVHATTPDTTQTDTVIVPSVPVDATTTDPIISSSSTPVSYFPSIINVFSHGMERVFAQETVTPEPKQSSVTEVILTDQATNTTQVTQALMSTQSQNVSTVLDESTTTKTSSSSLSATLYATSTASTSEITAATSTALTADIIFSSSTETIATTTDINQFQNNFLEVLFTFDGVTWTSLGELNEISMKYRTFEIPVTASTSWSDLGQLQIKIVSKRHDIDTPTVYLDGVKVEVLYESELNHMHPDFARDTILKDEIVSGYRIVTIINNDTKEKEIWYISVGDMASSTELDVVVASTITLSDTHATTSTSLSNATSTLGSTTTIKSPVLDLLKHVWKKYVGTDLNIGSGSLIEEIKKQEVLADIEKVTIIPDFASDTIKKMKGVSGDIVLVQIERGMGDTVRDELWLYDMDKNTEEKVGAGTSSITTTIAPDSPIGIKGGYLFWVSVDKATVYAYHIHDKIILASPLSSYNLSTGERGEVTFTQIPWKVIVSGERFSFSSPDTGEVFSDEDSGIVETFRIKLGLDQVLDKEELSNLNLSVSADISSSTNK